MMKLKQMRQTLRHKHLTASVVFGVCVILLSGCNLERFRHEKYSCNHSGLDIFDIIVRHAKEGSVVRITGSSGEREAIITSVNSKLIVIEGGGVSLEIYRKTGRITAQKRNKYYSLQCNASVFTL